MKKINDALQEYHKSKETIKAKREIWLSKTKEMIEDYFRAIEKENTKEVFVQLNEDITHNEQVFLCFMHKLEHQYNEQTIYNLQEKRKGRIVTRGGYLSISQKIDGNLHIWMAYPHVEELMKGNTKAKTFAQIDIESLTPEILEEYVLQFINEEINWPNHEVENTMEIPERTLIGFNFSPTEISDKN